MKLFRRNSKLMIAVGAFGLAAVLLVGLSGVVSANPEGAKTVGLIEDWTQRHVIFSNPGTAPDAMAQGRIEQWYRTVNNPRFVMQRNKRNHMLADSAAGPQDFAALAARLALAPPFLPFAPPHAVLRAPAPHRDWAFSLGNGTVPQNMYPAKYTFDINATPSCANDFVVYGLNAPGPASAQSTGTFTGQPTAGQTVTIGGSEVLTATAATAASDTGTFSGNPGNGNTVTITNGANSIVLTSNNGGTGVCTGAGNPRTGSFTRSATVGTDATNLRDLINSGNCGSFVGVSATRAGGVVTVTATTAGAAGNSIALAETFTNFGWASATLTGGADAPNTGTNFAIGAANTDTATNLAAAITRNGGTVGVTASSGGTTTVTVTATTPGAGGNSITLAEGLTNFTWSGGTLTGGVNNQSNIVALNNLYSGAGASLCNRATPTAFWAYGGTVSTGGMVTTSPVLSLDGSMVIYAESGGATGPYLHVLAWNSSDGGTVASPAVPTHRLAVGTGVGGCTSGQSCLVSILLNNTTATITNSSPFYEYASDTAYIGDDNGTLYKVTPVLGSGTPTVTKLIVASGTLLTGPVLDFSSGNVFVGSTNGALYAVKASTFTVASTTPLQVGITTCATDNNVLVDAPIVDSADGWVYEYVTDDPNFNTVITQASTTLAAGSFTGVTTAILGNGDSACNSSRQFPTHAPIFDNAYFSGPVTTGHMWACGRNGATPTSSQPALWEIPTSGTNGALGTPVEIVTPQINLDVHAQCSPMAEVFNGTTDFIFVGEGIANNTGTGATNFGSLYGFTLSGVTPTAITGSPVTEPTANGGISGIVIDNVSAAAQASSIYFTTLATSNNCGAGTFCAVKLTQAGLQ